MSLPSPSCQSFGRRFRDMLSDKLAEALCTGDEPLYVPQALTGSATRSPR
jgi:hypothetical protein